MPRGAPVLVGTARLAAGRRRALVTIEYRVELDTDAMPVERWESFGNVYMNRLDVRADERFTENQSSAFVETVWQMPYREDMDPDLVDVPSQRRLVFKSRVFNIRSAMLIGRQGIELQTLAGSRLPTEPS